MYVQTEKFFPTNSLTTRDVQVHVYSFYLPKSNNADLAFSPN